MSLPSGEQMQSWPIPSGGGTVRNIEVATGDVLWLAESSVEKIARFTIKHSATSTSPRLLLPAEAVRAWLRA
jgi:streptogramin lyase